MKKTHILILFAALLLVIALMVCIPIYVPNNAQSQYFCDVNPFALALNIGVNDMDNTSLYHITGEVFSTFEDNLVMRDVDGNGVREMRDNYNLITQNDHTILDGNGFVYHLSGKFKVVIDTYDIYDNMKNQIGVIEFNWAKTKGVIKNMDGLIVAQYNSNIWRSDYIVSIFDKCEIDDASVLMMFASYVSDAKADSVN